MLSGPKTFWSGLKMVLTGRARTYTGYPVDAEKAVAILELNSPHAAKWWRGNCPHLIGKGQLFIFDLDCANAA